MNETTTTENSGSSSPSAGGALLGGWIPVADQMPPNNKPVLLFYQNSHGMNRTVVGYHIAEFTVEADPDDENTEYHDENDTCYVMPGWYERLDNWDEYASVFIHSEITHWMPLPQPPNDEAQRRAHDEA